MEGAGFVDLESTYFTELGGVGRCDLIEIDETLTVDVMDRCPSAAADSP